MAQTVKITPASGLLEFIGNTTSNKPYLQHDDNGNLTLTLQATKKFTVAGNLKVNGKVTMAQQTLTDGAAITWDFNSGANAKVTLAGARTLVISNMEAGDTGLILVKQDAAGSRTLTLPGSSSIVGGGTYTASPAANATDVLGVYYDGTTYWWTIGYNTVTPPLTSVGITGGDFVIANSPLTANGNIGLALATVNSTVGTFGSATAVPVITVNAKGLVTAVSATNISIPTNLDSLTDVTITSAATNQLLQFNGSQWVNWTPNYITSYTETDTLATVTGRGATTNTAVTFNGNVTLGNNADLIFRDLAGTFPTSGKGFDWELNNDGARIYAIQPSSDSIDLVFQLRDNATTNDRFVFWVDDYQGAAYDKYPLIIRGGTEFDLVDSGLFVRGTQVLTNGRVLQNISGNISMFSNDSAYITNAALAGYATQTYVNTAVSNLVASSPAALDTLNELAAALGNDAAFSTTVSTALGNRLRVDINTQGLTATQKGYGRTNLGVVIGTDVQAWDGDLDAIAALVGTSGFLKKTAANTWSLDTNTYLTSYSETDTLASVTGRGATTNTASVFGGGLYARGAQNDGDYSSAALWTESYNNTTTGIAFHINGIVGKFLEMRTDQRLYWDNEQVWHTGNLTNLNQLTNGPGYITGYTETDTLASVTGRGATTNTALTLNGDISVGTAAKLSFGSQVRQMIELWSTSYGIGVQSSTQYFRTGGGFAWFRGGVHSDTENNAGGGVVAMRMDSTSNLTVTGNISASNFSGSSSGTNTGDQTNISGNAATATTVAWTGVTGRPTALSQFSNDLGNYGGWLTQAAANPLYVNVTGDSMTGPLVITGTTSGQELFAVNGVNGRLFTVSDDLSNSLFSVNTVAGLPVIEAFANNTVNIGPFSAPIVINASGISTPSHGTSANWNSAYNDTITSAAVSGTTSKTLTLTQRDGGTVTATWTDIDTDTDTNTDQQTLSVNGSTLSISGGNSITLPTSGISQATADGLYAAISHSHTFASLTSKPTTISGYGITDAITTGNIGSQSVNYATYAAYVENDSYYMRFHWSGLNGQPTWLWGGDEGENMYVYDPSNFSVNYANSAGSLSSMNISQFTNNSGYLTAESDTLATVTGRGATTSTPITVTGSEGREVAVYIPSSYSTDDLVSGHEYGWYADHWRLGMTRSGGAQGADFVVQWNAARRLSLTNGGNLTVTGTISSTNFSGTHSGSSSGTNTGDQTNISGNAATATALTSMNISQFTNNSGYITSYSETDTLYSVTNRGNTTIQDIEFTNGRKGLVGRYDAAQTQAIFAMGSNYTLADGAASSQIGNLYGLAWSYNPDYGGAGNNPQSKAGLNHQLLLMQNGITTAAMGSGIWTSGNITAANFSGSSSGTNTGDQTNISGNAATAGTATYASILSTTNQGIVGPTGLTTVSSTTQWSNYPIGYSAMFLQGQTATGTPSSNYGYFIKLANRDGGGGWGGIWSDYSGGDTYVGNTTTSASYANWYKLLSSTNYNSYSPTLTGTGASGTWSINITGSAGTAGSLTSMNISQFTNNSGYLTSITSGNVTTALGYTPWHAGNDGAGSGLDADLLDGYTSDTAANVNTIVRRDASGNIYSNYVLGSYFNASAGNSANPTIGQIWTQDTSDNYLRKSTPAHFRSQITDGYYLPLGGGTITGTVNFSNNNLDGVGHITMSDSGFGEGIQWESWFICDSPDDNSNQTGNLQFVYVPDNSVRMTFDTGGTLTLSNRLVELSSIRYKTNVESLTPALDKVLQLRPVYYTKIGGTGSTEIGLIAEEVAEIYPELIKYNDAGQVDGINYTRIAPILIKTIQEQHEIIKKLTERIENLENR